MSWVQKQRKAILFDQRLERHKLLLKRPWAGLLHRDPISRGGGGVLAGQAQAQLLPIAGPTWPGTAILNGVVVRSVPAYGQSSHPQLEHWHSHFTPGACFWSAGCEASARSTLWASESRLRTKAKKVRLYFTTEILFLFPGNSWRLCQWWNLSRSQTPSLQVSGPHSSLKCEFLGRWCTFGDLIRAVTIWSSWGDETSWILSDQSN